MTRWILFRCTWFGVYMHRFNRSDYTRALHDHPWPFVTLVLKGGYYEVHDQTIDGKIAVCWRAPGAVLVRPAEWRHRVELYKTYRPTEIKPRDYFVKERTSWSLVIVGRRQRAWGFFLPTGWCWWKKHNETLNICEDHIIHKVGND